MKNLTYIALAFVVSAGIAYYFVQQNPTNGSKEMAKYSSADVGLEFDYRTGPAGYVVDERIPVDFGDLVKVIILPRAEDAAKEPPVNGEGAPTITISVFNNAKKQFPRVWAEENIQYSNINLLTGDVLETVVGGANAIRYAADGLYASNNVVVAHGDKVYVIAGQFMDEDSDLYRDFSPLVESIRFIPEPGQE